MDLRLYHKDIDQGIILNIEKPCNFGIIKDEDFLQYFKKYLKDKDRVKDTDLRNQEVFFKILNIVNASVYVKSGGNQQYYEYNPDLKIYSSKLCHWDVIEQEYKIDIGESCYDKILFDELFKLTHERYDIGLPQTETSFERYKYIYGNGTVTYLALLGKKNWQKAVNIKYKKMIPYEGITKRSVKILPYNRDNYKKSIYELTGCNIYNVGVSNFPAFYKKKKRSVVVDKIKGFVFGLSYSVATLLARKSPREFRQIEIEYWSKIMSSTHVYINNKIVSCQKDESFYKLIRCVIDHLKRKRIEYIITGQTKYEWLKEVQGVK